MPTSDALGPDDDGAEGGTADEDSAPAFDSWWDELLYEAWVVIANANGGDWDAAHPEWKAAAERWRDKWHRTLDATHRSSLPPLGSDERPYDRGREES